MKILLTGSTSFTGKHLMPLLHKSGHDVFCLIRRQSPLENEFFWDFTSHVPAQIPVCDAVVHLAAYVDFGTTLRVDQYKVNTLSAVHLAAYARKHNSYFVFSSMTGVHGAAEFIDDKTSVDPQNNYALSKFLAEEVVRTFLERYAILRIGGIYGLDGPKHLGLNTSITEAFSRGVVPTLKGPGEAKRNYICVLDAALWILHLLKENADQKKPGQNLYYFAGSETLTIAQYLRVISDELLEGRKIIELEGQNGPHSIVNPSACPFVQTRFVDYLRALKSFQKEGAAMTSDGKSHP